VHEVQGDSILASGGCVVLITTCMVHRAVCVCLRIGGGCLIVSCSGVYVCMRACVCVCVCVRAWIYDTKSEDVTDAAVNR